jgi:microcystin degradation protein MlrC
MPRIAVASYIQESNSFAPALSEWRDFEQGQVFYGDEIFRAARGTRSEVAGALEAAEAAGGVELIGLMRAMQRSSGGPIRREVHERICGEIITRLAAACAPRTVDGVLLVLHGAMCAEDCDDATGDVIARVRTLVGPDVPIYVTLDLHAVVTHTMAQQSTALIGYETFPHVDLWEAGEKAMRLMLRQIAGKSRPTNVTRRLPMIVAAENAQTTHGILADLRARFQAECAGADGPFHHMALFPMQPWCDVPEAGCVLSFVVEQEQRELGERVADSFADQWWNARAQHAVDLADTDAVIAEALAADRGPWVLADSADAPSSGAPGDSSVTIAALLRAQPQHDCCTNVVDPLAVAQMIEAGVGAEVTVRLGANSGCALYEPVEVRGVVERITDGDFTHDGPGLRGQVMHRGPTAVLRCGRVRIVVMEQAVLQWDRQLYLSVGIDPAQMRVVIVKSPAGFRADYAPIAAEIRILDAPGVCTPNVLSLPFRKIARPMWPFDAVADWRDG